MKRILRITSAILAVAMCLSLCSCGALDEMREKHAKIKENGNIELNGYEYVPVDLGEASEDVSSYYYDLLNVTALDVPVLLSGIVSDFTGKYAYINREKTAIEVMGVDITSYADAVYYIRSDIKDEVMQQVQNGVQIEKVYYKYYDAEGEYKERILTEEEAAVIETLMASASQSHEIYLDGSVHRAQIWGKDKFGIFMSEKGSIYEQSNGGYYFEIYDYFTFEYKQISVPAEYESIVAKIVAEAKAESEIYEDFLVY